MEQLAASAHQGTIVTTTCANKNVSDVLELISSLKNGFSILVEY